VGGLHPPLPDLLSILGLPERGNTCRRRLTQRLVRFLTQMKVESLSDNVQVGL